MTAAPELAPETLLEGPGDVQHVVDWWEDVVLSRLRGEAPKALCGASLEQGLDDRPTLDDDPLCPACAEILERLP